MNANSPAAPLLSLSFLRESIDFDPERLQLVRLKGREAVSELFDFQLDLVADNELLLRPRHLLGRQASVAIARPGSPTRHVTGVIVEFALRRRDDRYFYYEARLAPALWFATRRRRSRVFQRMSVPQIVEEVLRDLYPSAVGTAGRTEDAAPPVRFVLGETHRKLNYCVQYEETDFDFVCRLLQDEGLFFCFEHSANDHRLTIADRSYARPALADAASLAFDDVAGGLRTEARISTWESRQRICSGKFTHWDYWFKDPQRSLVSAHVAGVPADGRTPDFSLGGGASLEVVRPVRVAHYDDFVDEVVSEGERIESRRHERAHLLLERETASALAIHGGGDVVQLAPGFRFELSGHYCDDGDYFLVSVDHEAEQPLPHGAGGNPSTYRNSFTCIPSLPGMPYRPPERTPRPIVPGTQTATVVGPAGEEIYVDPFGRIKVRFHWDARGADDGENTCWIRVAQFWAGKRFGAFFWPRVGQEVVVGFEDGDPDRPLVLGSVYNGKNMPPLELPDMKRTAGIKSCTVGGDPADQFNSVFFHDQPGDEHLHLHSETYECITCESAGIHYTSGSRFDIISPSLPQVTSGAGGGAVEVAFPIARMALQGLSKTGGEFASRALQPFFGSRISFAGDTMDAVINGDRTSHIIAGDDTHLHFKFDDLFFGSRLDSKLVAGLVACVSNFHYPKPSPGAPAPEKAVAAKRTLLKLLRPNGTTAVFAGVPQNYLMYSGDYLNVIRGGDYLEVNRKDFWSIDNPANTLVQLLVIQIGIAATLYDLISSNTLWAENTPTRSDEIAKDDGKAKPVVEKSPGWKWAEWVAGDLSIMLTGALQMVEKTVARLDAAFFELRAAKSDLHQVAAVIKNDRNPIVARAKAQTLENRIQKSIYHASRIKLTFLEDRERARYRQTKAENVVCNKMHINAFSKGKDPGVVDISASTMDNGLPSGRVMLSANQCVRMSCQGEASINLTNDGAVSKVEVINGGAGDITLRQGPLPNDPTVKLSKNVNPGVALAYLGNTARVDAFGVAFNLGGEGDLFTNMRLNNDFVRIKAPSITFTDMTGSSKIELTADGIKISALNLQLEGKLAQKLKTLLLNIN